MSKSRTYLFHEISSYLPLLEGEEFDALVDDIRQFGQIESAILYEGKILDGRNRYRACQILKIDLKVREWKPSELTGMSPLQFVISENIMRRHLNVAQRSEVGLLLLEEEEKQAKERISKISKAKANIQNIKGKKDFQKISDKNQEKLLTQEIKKIQDEMGSGSSAEKVGKQVKVGHSTITKAKKIKEIAKKDKEIAEGWEKAKKGDIGVDAVYKKVQEKEKIEKLENPEIKKEMLKSKPKITIKEAEELDKMEDKEVVKAVLQPKSKITVEEAKEVSKLSIDIRKELLKENPKITLEEAKEVAKLPEDVKKEVLKPESKITVEDAKEIANIPKPEIRKEAIRHIEKEKELHKDTLKHITNIAKGVTPPPTKIIDIEQKVINQFIDIKKQIIIKMSRKHVESYNESTQNELIRIMKECLEYLQKELNIKGDIINV